MVIETFSTILPEGSSKIKAKIKIKTKNTHTHSMKLNQKKVNESITENMEF